MTARTAFLLLLPLGIAACTGDDALTPLSSSEVAEDDASLDGLENGHRLMETGEFEQALKAYLLAASERGIDVDVLSALGSANLRLGRLGQAEDLLRRAIREDETFAPAWNNLGVVLMEQGETGEARRVFQTAFALDSGESAEIRDNLKLAIAKTEITDYTGVNETSDFELVRRGRGVYRLLSTP
ncbi:MAG: tetratricopeptide repeat protein [Celeribacter sp.]|jgi:Flp pilus assembly protein TadD